MDALSFEFEFLNPRLSSVDLLIKRCKRLLESAGKGSNVHAESLPDVPMLYTLGCVASWLSPFAMGGAWSGVLIVTRVGCGWQRTVM
jgi:hypothetical protein